jgi:acetylornithine deacetylase/succinyl-diaminopimelate desuccinylase-like protein
MGLGAANPKGHGACIVAAITAIRRAAIPLLGDLFVGFGAGGMPSNRRATTVGADRWNVGQGVGCAFMLEQGVHPDYAVIAKPGWGVAWEEVGLCWFKVTVHGTFNYVGSRHRLPYRNSIVGAATFVKELERWLPEYSSRNTSGLVSPQGQVGYIQGGWEHTASLSPAACVLLIDLRVSPRTAPGNAKRQFAAFIADVRSRHPDLELTWEMVLSIAGSSTDPNNWVIQSCIEAWEAVEGQPHQALTETSGATDANVLRGRGIPTARVGMPKPIDDQGVEVDFAMGMNATDVRHMTNLTRLLIHAAVATCTRRPSEHSCGGER